MRTYVRTITAMCIALGLDVTKAEQDIVLMSVKDEAWPHGSGSLSLKIDNLFLTALLSLIIVTFFVGMKVGRWSALLPWPWGVRRQTRTIQVQSQTTYTWKTAAPRFRVLGEHLQGMQEMHEE